MKIKKIDLFNVSTRYLVLSVNVLNLKIGIGCLVEKWSTDREHQQQKKKHISLKQNQTRFTQNLKSK